MIYLDNSATTQVLKSAAELINYYNTERFFNPSAVYAGAVEAHKDIAAARRALAKILCCDEQELTYFSGGTEANNAALTGALKGKKGRIIATAGEHMSVYKTCLELKQRGYDVVFARLDSCGRVDLPHLLSLVNDQTLLVSVIHVSNETGAVNDIKDIAAKVKQINADTLIHSDGVQAFLKRTVNLADLGADLYTLSGHKVHAPKGVAALYVKKGVRLKPQIFGGGQERGIRSGTENVAAICALSHCAQLLQETLAERVSHISALKQAMCGFFTANMKDFAFNGDIVNTAPNIISMSIGGIKSEVLLQMLSDFGVYIGSGSACSTSAKTSRVLKELNARYIDGSVRISFSHLNTARDAEYAARQIVLCTERLRALKV